MKKLLITGIVSVSLMTSGLTAVFADTSSMNAGVTGMGILENDYVRAGVNGTAGTFGSGGNTSPGLLFDSTGTGTFNTSYDYLTPGSPFDGFSIMVDGTNYSNNNGRSNSITGDGNGLTDGTNSLSWTGGVASVFDITNTYSLGATSPYIDITSQITMGTAATDVWFSRHIDPDARAASGDSSSTDNVLGYGVIPDSNVAFSEALASRYALGLYSTDSNVDAGITGWTTDANSYTYNRIDGEGDNTNTGDNTIGLSWHWTSVSAGDILTANYAYIFGPSAFDAAEDAVTGGAGGGADVSSWGTLEDVGSATDAASGPTIVDTIEWTEYSEYTITDDPTRADTVSYGSETHSLATGTQSIVQTDGDSIVRSRDFTDYEKDEYSDGSFSAVRTVTTGTLDQQTYAYSDTTHSGRIDQVDQFNNQISAIGFQLDRQNAKHGVQNGDTRTAINATRQNYNGNHGYNGDTNIYGIAVEKDIDNNHTVGLQINRINNNLDRSDTNGGMNFNHVGVYNSYNVNGFTIEGDLSVADGDVQYTRTIGPFTNSLTIDSRLVWVSGKVIAPEIAESGIRPFVGATWSKSKVSGQPKETGSSQTALPYVFQGQTDRTGIYGLTYTKSVGEGITVDAEISRDTDKDRYVMLGVNKTTGDITFSVNAGRQWIANSTTDQVGFNVNWKF